MTSLAALRSGTVPDGRLLGRAPGAGAGPAEALSARQAIAILRGDDGAGSQLDADTVDGRHASAFAPAAALADLEQRVAILEAGG